MLLRRIAVLLILFCGSLTTSLAAQGPVPADQTFRDAILKQRRFLRGFNGDDRIHWQWRGATLVQHLPTVHTLGVFTAQSIKIKGNNVTIEGGRRTLLRTDTSGPVLSKSEEKVRIEIDLTGADLAEVVPKLADTVFYPNQNDVLMDLPAKYHRLLNMNPIKTAGEKST